MVEIERKFLVKSLDFISLATNKSRTIQGYIFSTNNKSLRVRIKEGKGYLTIKGESSKSGLSRDEFEYPIPISDAQDMLNTLSEHHTIIKDRYEVPFGGHTFEVDIFKGNNSGLIVCELELNDENEEFLKPEWLGEEITGDVKYYNSALSKNPYTKWKK